MTEVPTPHEPGDDCWKCLKDWQGHSTYVMGWENGFDAAMAYMRRLAEEVRSRQVADHIAPATEEQVAARRWVPRTGKRFAGARKDKSRGGSR